MDRPPILGIMHLRLAAFDILKTKDFYCNIMGCEYLRGFHRRNKERCLFAVIVRVDHGSEDMTIEIRQDSRKAGAQHGCGPITFGVKTRDDLELWKEWFEQNDVHCSKVFRGLRGWVSCALDPDGRIVRLCCDESHEWDPASVDTDDFWLG